MISLSGVNDLAYRESVNQFNGQEFIHWIKNASPNAQYCSGVCNSESLYTDKGHEVLANKIFETIMPIIQV